MPDARWEKRAKKDKKKVDREERDRQRTREGADRLIAHHWSRE